MRACGAPGSCRRAARPGRRALSGHFWRLFVWTSGGTQEEGLSQPRTGTAGPSRLGGVARRPAPGGAGEVRPARSCSQWRGVGRRVFGSGPEEAELRSSTGTVADVLVHAGCRRWLSCVAGTGPRCSAPPRGRCFSSVPVQRRRIGARICHGSPSLSPQGPCRKCRYPL